MVIKLIGSAVLLWLGITLSACTVSGSVDWYGQTAKDARTISPSLYPQDVNQARETKQRY